MTITRLFAISETIIVLFSVEINVACVFVRDVHVRQTEREAIVVYFEVTQVEWLGNV